MPLPLLILLTLCLAAAPATQPARDDAPALQRQLGRSSAVVTLPPLAYRVASPIALVNIHDLTVFAYGASLNSAPTQPMGVRIGDTLRLEHCQRIRIFGLSIDANRVARGGFNADSYAVHLLSSDDVTFRDCTVTGALCDGLIAWGGLNPPWPTSACQRLTIDHCRIADPGRNGISLVGAAWSSVTGCDFTGPGGNPGVAVDVEANVGDPDGINHHILISGNRVQNFHSAFFVVKTAKPTNVTITGNLVDNTSGDGIFVEGTDCVVAGNQLTHIGRAAVSVCNGGEAAVNGNNAAAFVYQGP